MILIVLGEVPEHVAFVMDGNRRYAEQQHVDKATGHTHGYGKMVDVIHWCIELGVKHITVYAFSIDNFKRAHDEVSALMHLAEAKYAELSQDGGLAEREGIQMHIVGDLALPPPAVQGAAARLMRNTAALRTKRATLNVCFSYTSSEECVHAAAALQAAVRSGALLPGDVDPAALHGSLRTGPASPPVDLLLRTSGETRLSDFLLWQAAHAHLAYTPTLWPDLSYLEFARCVLSYQRHARTLAALRRRAGERLRSRCGAQRAAAEGGGDGGEEAQERVGVDGDVRDAAAASTGDAGPVASGAGARGLRARSHATADASCSGRSGGGGGVPGLGGEGDAAAGSEPAVSPNSLRRLAGCCLRYWARCAPSWTSLRGLLAAVARRRAGASSGVPGAVASLFCGGEGGAARELRLLRFFRRLEQERLAWIAAHADL